MINIVKSLEVENMNRLQSNYSLHNNRSTQKAISKGYTITNTCQAHITNSIDKLNQQLENGTLLKKVNLKSNSKLDGIPTIGFPNIFIQSSFMTLYVNNRDKLEGNKAATTLYNYFSNHKVCRNCGRCSGLCYNNKFHTQYPQKAISELRILLAYIVDPEGLAAKIIRVAKNSKSGLFRINQDGEIHSEKQFSWWIDICTKVPNIEFYVYTKAFELFEECLQKYAVPSNFHINMSVIEGQEEHLKQYTTLYNGNKFKMVTSIPEGSTTTCTGNCSTCGRLCMKDLPKDNNTIYCLYHN